jgi:hypothetical protein
MNKREKERLILGTVYDASRFRQIVQQESPDFVVHHFQIPERFGVEVTELYYSEADARLRNIPGYVTHLANGGRHYHRDDVSALQVVALTITAPDGTIKFQDETAVLRGRPPVEAYVDRLATLIRNKDSKFARYKHGLSHVNLIVFDHETLLSEVPRENIGSYLLTPELKNVLANTQFREVYFVTRVAAAQQVYIPLRMLLLASEAYLINRAFSKFWPDLEFSSLDSELRFAVTCMNRMGIPALISHALTDQVEIVLGNSSLTVQSGSHVAIKDHSDLPIRTSRVDLEDLEHNHALTGGFMKFLLDYSSQNAFVAGIAFDVLSDLTISMAHNSTATLSEHSPSDA